MDFVVYSEDETGRLLTAIEGEERRGGAAAAVAPEEEVAPSVPPADAPAEPEVAMETE
jgi:hypothetical protein